MIGWERSPTGQHRCIVCWSFKRKRVKMYVVQLKKTWNTWKTRDEMKAPQKSCHHSKKHPFCSCAFFGSGTQEILELDAQKCQVCYLLLQNYNITRLNIQRNLVQNLQCSLMIFVDIHSHCGCWEIGITIFMSGPAMNMTFGCCLSYQLVPTVRRCFLSTWNVWGSNFHLILLTTFFFAQRIWWGTKGSSLWWMLLTGQWGLEKRKWL